MLIRSKTKARFFLSCTACSAAMSHTHSIPAAGGLEEILAFCCDTCGWRRTVAAWNGDAREAAH